MIGKERETPMFLAGNLIMTQIYLLLEGGKEYHVFHLNNKSYSLFLGVRVSGIVGNTEVTFLNTSDRMKNTYTTLGPR